MSKAISLFVRTPPPPEPQNKIIELDQTELDYFNPHRLLEYELGSLLFLGFFIVSASVMAAHEGLISRDWLDEFFCIFLTMLLFQTI